MDTLEVVTGDTSRIIDLTGARVTIGRGDDNDVVLSGDRRASRRHAVLTRDNGVWLLADRNSMNGTYVNSVRISAPVEVSVGDRIHVGSTAILVSGSDAEIALHNYIDLDAHTRVSEV